MNKRLLESNKEHCQDMNEQVKGTWARMCDIGSKLLKNRELTLTNIDELAQRIAEKQEYEAHRLIVCDESTLKGRLDSHKDDNINEQPILIICHNEKKSSFTFCIVERKDAIICLIKGFSNNHILDVIKRVVKENFGENVEFKVHLKVKNVENRKYEDILSLKTLETMMVHLKTDKKQNFIENFDNPEETFFEWLKNGCYLLKNELFSLVKEGYYATAASDIDQLSRDTKFKEAIKKLIDNIPHPEDAKLFKNYHTLLKEFAEINENDIDMYSDEVKEMQIRLEQARVGAFRKVDGKNVKVLTKRKGDQQLDIVKDFPDQMEKFTRIFEPLVFSNVDEKFNEELKSICIKLGLEYEKLKIFFEMKEERKRDNNDVAATRNINEVIRLLPTLNKTFEQLLAEIIATNSELSIEILVSGYIRTKNYSKSWSVEGALKINEWAVSKRGKLADSEIYEAIAVLDRANELVTGEHKLRDTQILSVLTFLQQREKGQLSQIQTGEGKTTIVAVLAAIKALQGEKVDVITSNPVLADDGIKDKQLFYDLLNLSAATNNLDENYKSGPRNCYKADIVYGTISNFQFDYLKDSFIGLSTRGGRPFDSVILDEVDSMIIDNASHIAKLSEQLPGMENLKYIYIKIWQELHKAEQKITLEFGERLKLKAKEIEQLAPSDHMAQPMYGALLNELKNLIIPEMKESIKRVEPTKVDIIPSHIQEYADNSLDRWIDSAIDAKFIYHEDEQYVIRMKNNEQVIQPVDYANTGVTLKNTIWQYGLHQFLQLKHNLHLTSESLTSCFISNLGYINKYGNQIFGLTGTLGSEAEQSLLSSIYNVGFAKIPTYKEKKFTENESTIANDEIFSTEIAKDVTSKVKDGRAVLIICETIKDAKAIQEALSKSNVTIKTFFDEENAHVTEEKVNSGDVVIATNIAGRGTDFKTSAKLERNNGLHICVAFLPCNKRVEDQAFGRTSRQGNHGTAQLFIKRSVIDNLDIDSNCFETIKNARDEREKNRLQLINDIKIPELKFQDTLFERFSTLYKSLQEEFECKREFKYVLDDLKEFWAFWLNRKNFAGSEIINKSVEDEFEDFLEEADKVIKGEIQFNPYYSIQQAEFFISSNETLNKAEQSLNHALSISKNPEILYSAYLKFFEIAIERGGVFIDKCRTALSDIFFIPKVEPDREYKKTAKKYLILAKKAFNKELDYIGKLVEDKEFQNILSTGISTSNPPQKENLFIKHIVSKQQAVRLFMNHVDSLIRQIDECAVGLSIGCRIPDYLSNLKPKTENEKKIKDVVTNAELAELAASGTNIMYALREVQDVCPEIAKAAQVQIAGGTMLIAIGFCFPPAMMVTTSIGATMITEGICDIAVELINKNSNGKFDKKAYIKGKVISYGISLLTIGINTALQCPIILEKAKNACRWISETLRKCPFLNGACELLAGQFDKLADWFEKMEIIAKFNHMSKLEKLKYFDSLDLKFRSYIENLTQYKDLLKELQEVGGLRELTHFEHCASTLKQMKINILNVTRTVESVMMKKILDSSMSEFKFQDQKNVNTRGGESLRKHEDCEKSSTVEVIKNKIKKFMLSIVYEIMKQLFNGTFNYLKQNIIMVVVFVILFFGFLRVIY